MDQESRNQFIGRFEELGGKAMALFDLVDGPDQSVFAQADQLVTLDAMKALAEAIVKDINAQVARMEKVLYESMVNEEVPSFTRSGFDFDANRKTFINDVADRREDLFRVLRDRGLGDIIKTKEDVHSATLGKAIRELIEDNGGELPAEFEGLVRVYDAPVVTRKKAKK